MILPTQVLNKEGTDFSDEARQALQVIIQTDENNLSHEYVEIPRYLQWWGVVVAQLKARVEETKILFDVEMATWYPEKKAALAAAGDKTTEKAIDMAITADPKHQEWKRSLITASRLHTEGVAHLEALRAKKEMAVSLGFQKKFEMEMELRASQTG